MTHFRVSQVREVPDHQEIFSDADTDQSIIVEIVEYQPVSDTELGKYAYHFGAVLWANSCRYHFDEIADVGGASEHSLVDVRPISDAEMPGMPAGVTKLLVIGDMKVCII